MYCLKHYDPLTELPNQQKLIKKIEESGDNEKFVIYIDRFYSINTLYWHETGDEIILQLSSRLQKLFTDKRAVFIKNGLHDLGGDQQRNYSIW